MSQTREEKLAVRREWQRRNRAKLAQQRKAHYEKHRDEILTRRRTKYAEDPAPFKAIVSRYQQAHPEKVAEFNNRRRALRQGVAINDFTAAEWTQVVAIWDNRCAYCGEATRLTQDHDVPLSRGGNHTMSNIVPACKPCNSKKKDKTGIEFMGSGWGADRNTK